MHRLGMGRSVAVGWRLLAGTALLVATVAIAPRAGIAPAVWAQEAIVAPPSAPALAAPPDGAMLESEWGAVELQWQPVPGAVDYQVILNGGERTGPWVAGTSWSPGTLPAGTYEWAVQARNAAGVSSLGPSFSFTVQPNGGYQPAAAVPPDVSDPLPFQLQQHVEQGRDGVAVEYDDGSMPAPAATTTTTAAGTPVPVATGTAPVATDAAPVTTDAAPVMAETPVPSAETVVDGADVTDTSGAGDDTGKDKEKKDKKAADEGEKPEREKREREPRERQPNNSRGNGGVSEVVAAPPTWTAPQSFAMAGVIQDRLADSEFQQDATDATAGSVGENGTVNGRPREETDNAPAEASGPAAPGEVMLPPSVPGVPGAVAPNVNPDLAAGVASTTELTFDAISDTTVFLASPGSPQSPESVGSLALGGPQGAVALMSFEVTGVGDGTVLAARLTFHGAGGAGAPGGSVGVIYDYVVPEGATANGIPNSETALNVHGAPAWFERVEPNGLTAVDVTGSVAGDGVYTFVLPGQPEAAAAINALESGSPPQLILTVALPG